MKGCGRTLRIEKRLFLKERRRKVGGWRMDKRGTAVEDRI